MEANTIYYPNGILMKEYMVLNGKIEGPHKTYFRNGNIESITNYFDGKKHGDSTTYYINGNISNISTYYNGALNGMAEFYHLKGFLILTVNYINGYKNGIEYKYYKSGILQSISNFVNNKRDGEHIIFDSNGKIKNEFLYKNGDEIPMYVDFNIRNPNGFIIEQYTERNGLRNGFYATYYTNDECDYANTHIHTPKIGQSYHKSLKLKAIGVYSQGKKHGVFRYFNTKGDIIDECNYVDDCIL